MSEWIAELVEQRFGVEQEASIRLVHMLGVSGAALLFALLATFIVASGDLISAQSISNLQVGEIANQDIFAPRPVEYVSEVLSLQAQERARASVDIVYDPPDTTVARRQTDLARQILDFIDNIRRDIYGTPDQKLSDVGQIATLDLTEAVRMDILELDEETWRAVDEQVVDVLERVSQESIREADLDGVKTRLPIQVGSRFEPREREVIVSIVEDLVRPNTFPNPDETAAAREIAAENVTDEVRSFERGQTVVRAGERIDPSDFEALQELGLLEVSPDERFNTRVRALAQSFMGSLIVLIVIGLFVSRFTPTLFQQPRFMILSAVIFLLALLGARFVGTDELIYLYPTSAMALLFVSIIGPEVAIISILGLALLIGFMINQRLELSALVAVGGLIGTLTLHRAERLNSYFFAGLLIALANTVVIVMFNLGTRPVEVTTDLILLVSYGLINGLLAAAVAMAGMYIVTLLFNLPTGLRLVELSQPNQPILQRLLRDAPGTYQHSLQVANLSEQATNAIGGNAELIRVAALYHDVGKMLNAPFFVENQADGVNPHDALGDPYRSADIIISHVTEGAKLARQNRLPVRIRDFIKEHHGTTRVEYFYRLALANAEDGEEIDPVDFTYPGPIPQSKETAIMMLADSCESTVRARRPSSKQEINDIVQQIIDARMRDGQLDESGLTSNDIKTIRTVFVDMLQAVFHPRINYPSATPNRKKTIPEAPTTKTSETNNRDTKSRRSKTGTNEKLSSDGATKRAVPKTPSTSSMEVPAIAGDEDDDDSPLEEVPPLPRTTSEGRATTEEEESE